MTHTTLYEVLGVTSVKAKLKKVEGMREILDGYTYKVGARTSQYAQYDALGTILSQWGQR